MLSVYVAQWVPFLADFLSKFRGWLRAAIVALSIILVAVFAKNADGSQLTLAFIMSNFGYELLVAILEGIGTKLPPTLSTQLREQMKDKILNTTTS